MPVTPWAHHTVIYTCSVETVPTSARHEICLIRTHTRRDTDQGLKSVFYENISFCNHIRFSAPDYNYSIEIFEKEKEAESPLSAQYCAVYLHIHSKLESRSTIRSTDTVLFSNCAQSPSSVLTQSIFPVGLQTSFCLKSGNHSNAAERMGGSWTCTADVKKQNLIFSIIFPSLIFLRELFTRSYRWNASEQTVSG